LVAELKPEELGRWTFCFICALAFLFSLPIILPKGHVNKGDKIIYLPENMKKEGEEIVNSN